MWYIFLHIFVVREMPDSHGVGSDQHGFQDFDESEYVNVDEYVNSGDVSEGTSLEYCSDNMYCRSPPNPRERRRKKAQSVHARIAQERDIIANLDQHKKRIAKDTKYRSCDRTHTLPSGDAESISQAAVATSSSSTVVKVDTLSRIMCLNPKPVTKQDDGLSDGNLQPVPLPGISSAAPQYEDRCDFYQTFSMLIRLGNVPKKEKEPKGGGGGLFGSSPYARQQSTEQEMWQTHLCDLIWFELQAYINVRTNKDQDDFLCEARKGIGTTLDRVMSFNAAGITDNSSDAQIFTNGLTVECLCSRCKSRYSGVCLQQVIRKQCAVSKMVMSLLDDVENAESLYPTQKALANEHPVYAEHEFQQRIATLCLWMTITRDIAHKLKLMAEIAYISDQSLIGTAWSCVDLHSLKTLVSGYSGKDVYIADDDHSVLDDDGNDEGLEAANSETSVDSGRATFVPHGDILRQKSVHFEDEQGHRGDAQCRSERRRYRISRPNSTEVTPTSIYRLYVDALLKKTGLRKLLARLKDLLDATLQRARLALLPGGDSSVHGISNISKVLPLAVTFPPSCCGFFIYC